MATEKNGPSRSSSSATSRGESSKSGSSGSESSGNGSSRSGRSARSHSGSAPGRSGRGGSSGSRSASTKRSSATSGGTSKRRSGSRKSAAESILHVGAAGELIRSLAEPMEEAYDSVSRQAKRLPTWAWVTIGAVALIGIAMATGLTDNILGDDSDDILDLEEDD